MKVEWLKCLNPYSTGSWVAGKENVTYTYPSLEVLILILLEVGLLVVEKKNGSLLEMVVLILILLEVGLLALKIRFVKIVTLCLNPYSTGSLVAGVWI